MSQKKGRGGVVWLRTEQSSQYLFFIFLFKFITANFMILPPNRWAPDKLCDPIQEKK